MVINIQEDSELSRCTLDLLGNCKNYFIFYWK